MSLALLYGATGYTGALIARHAQAYGIRLLLAARDAGKLAPLATPLGLEQRAFDLADPAAIRSALKGVSVVLNCAGPFAHTFEAMADACIAAGVHYLDITGEIDVFEAAAARDVAAKRAGVMLMPGVGVDVVATDCLAVHLKRWLPTATRLTLALQGSGRSSRGTLNTMVEALPHGARVRRAGRIERVPLAWHTRAVDFGDGPRQAITIPWGDVSTAYHSTGIPDIEVLLAASPRLRRLARAARMTAPLLGARVVQGLVKRRIAAGPPGANERELAEGVSRFWGRVEDDAGRSAEARLRGPSGSLFTAHAALLVLRRVLAGSAPAGFQTPAMAYGPDLVLEVAGVVREAARPVTI